MKAGIGYDLHRTEPGDGVFLGGVFIKADYRFVAHSDGDVVLHALTDAILGAIGEDDLGTHFPPDDEKWKGASSADLLKIVLRKYSGHIGKIINTDIVLIIETPKMALHQKAIKENLAMLLGTDMKRIGFKIKSGEGIGDVGEGRAVACHCIILLEGNDA